MPELPPFPVDPGTLVALEGAIREDPELGVGLDELLELLAGWTPGDAPDTIHETGTRAVDVPALYSREDVILALITEVRTLRADVERWSRSWATAAEALAPDWPQAPA